MKLPKSFALGLRKIEGEKKREIERMEKEQREYERKVAAYEKKEHQLVDKKMEMARKIFKWADEFRKTKEWKQLRKPVHVFYYPEFANAMPEPDRGRRSSMYLTERDFVLIMSYDWASGRQIRLKTPEDMAELNYDFLKEFLKTIENEKIYKFILENQR